MIKLNLNQIIENFSVIQAHIKINVSPLYDPEIDNIDIVINELDALFNIDLDLKTEKTDRKQIELLRIGTCGILQSDIPVHSYVLSEYALGLDNVGHFCYTVL